MHVKPSFFRARQSQQETKWTSDHVGPGGKSSMGVLLDWLAAPGNYDRWQHCTRVKKSRQPLADEIVGRLQAEGLVHRTTSQVQTKMAELEHSYREAAERLASTKRELQAAEGTPAERNLRRVLERHCRYFALLQPIMQTTIDKVVDSPSPKRPRLTTKRKVVPPPVAAPVVAPAAPVPAPAPVAPPAPTPAPARAASPPLAKRSYSLRERRGMEPMGEEMLWDFDNESVGGIRSPPTPPTPPTTRLVRKSKRRAMESISVMRLEEEEHQEHIQFRQIEQRNPPPESVKKRPVLRSIEEIDLEKARVELTLRQLEVQMAQDKALVARAKARAQMLDHGVPRQEVERLMPLNV